jgi:hypothetical protein
MGRAAWRTPNQRQPKMVAAILTLGEASLVHKLGDHHQAHSTKWRQPFELHIDPNLAADTLIAIQPAVVNLNRQSLILAHTADFNMEAGRASVAMLNCVDTRLAKRSFDIFDPLAVETQSSRECGDGIASDFLVAKLARK